MAKGGDYERPDYGSSSSSPGYNSRNDYSSDNRGSSRPTSASKRAHAAYLETMAGRAATANATARQYVLDGLLDPKRVAITGSQKFDAKGLPVPDTMEFKNGHRWYECLDYIDTKTGEAKKVKPIVVAFDITESRGGDVEPVFDKVPMIIGQLSSKGYADCPAISFCAIGDATVDQVPIQASYFETDTRLDEALAKIHACMERGGGGTGQESYELAALLYAERSKLDSIKKHDEKGIFVFIGDEGFYPKVSAKEAKEHLGITIPKGLDSAEVFRRLQETYEVFFIYPASSWQDRKASIDKEIEQRVKAAGGQYENVDLRASLSWNTRDDLDIHCICPDGSHIYYPPHERLHFGGELDVDANCHSATATEKPIENIRWPKGKARAGHYKFYAHLYQRRTSGPISFRAELENNGKIEHFESKFGEGHKDVIDLFEVDYDPNSRTALDPSKRYAGYDDKLIRGQWASVIPESHIVSITDPKGIADTIVGIIALYSGTSLDEYDKDMASRKQTAERRTDVGNALRPLYGSLIPVEQEGSFDDLG